MYVNGFNPDWTLAKQKEEESRKKVEGMTKIAEYSYEHNDGDHIWENVTSFYAKEDGSYIKKFYEGYYGTETFSEISYEEIADQMNNIKKEAEKKAERVALYGGHHPCSRGGYSICMELQPQESVKKNEDIEMDVDW